MTPTDLRNFYLTGKGLDDFRVTLPLRPAALEGIELPHLERDYPVCIAGDAASAWPVPFSAWTPAHLACSALHAERKDARTAFLQDVEETAQRLEDLLAVDEDKSGAAASDAVAASLGARAKSLLNPAAWADALRRRPSATHSMEPERRVRCECALSTLRDAISAAKSEHPVTLIHTGEATPAHSPFGIDYQAAAADHVCDLALSLLTERLNRRAQLWRALRIARLELDSKYESASHAAHIEGFDWTMATAAELAAVPAVVVFAGAREVAASLASFARLVRSGLPVAIVISCPDGEDEDLGCLPLAYPEAFALASCTGAPDHLAAGLLEMARSLRPAIALVAVSESPAEAAALTLSRSWPLYRYNPDQGETWRDRFALHTDRPAAYQNLTPLYAAALLPAFRDHFRLVPEMSTTHSFACLPSPLVAVYTRQIETQCARAERRWRMLEELATPLVVKEQDVEAVDRARLEGATEAIRRAIALINC